MPLELLLILVIGGIAAIAGLLHLSGRSVPCALTEAEARLAWLRQYPDSDIAGVILSQDRHSALIQQQNNTAPLGLVWSFGADTVARTLEHAELGAWTHGLCLGLADFSAPKIRLRLATSERELWLRLIAAQTLDQTLDRPGPSSGTRPNPIAKEV